MTPPPITAVELAERYQALLIDAYGVLNDARGALPGAAELVAWLRERGQTFFVATNDASRTPETIARRLSGFGIPVDPAQVIASGSLLSPHFEANGLRGARCMVLGTDDSCQYVVDAGGRVVAPEPGTDCEAVVVADDEGYEFLPGVEAALNAIVARVERGAPIALVLPNPDLIYPKGEGRYGFTSGAVAMLIEAGLERRLGDGAPRFERLGKPHRPLFDEARRRAGTDSLVMIGDQIETDILGARRAGIDAALLATGVSRRDDATGPEAPTYLLESLAGPKKG